MPEFSVLDGAAVTALITPYGSSGDIDYHTFRKLLMRQIQAGIKSVVVGGTTGEGHLLSDIELLELIKFSVRESESQLAVIGNTSGLCTRKVIERTKAGFEAGMVATLQVAPYYGKTSRQGRAEHLGRLLELGPSIIYNVPARTHVDLEPSEILHLAGHRNFIGVKECAGVDRMKLLLTNGICFWSGNDDQARQGRLLGSNGMISVIGNILPEATVALMEHQEISQKLQVTLEPLLEFLGCEPNPIPVKTLLAMTGAIQPVFRLPYVPLTKEQMRQGLEILTKFSLESLVGESPRFVDFKVVI